MVYGHHSDYYQAINISTQKTDSAPFIEFMLGVILETIEGSTDRLSPQVTPQVKSLLNLMSKESSPRNRDELQQLLGLKDRKSFRDRCLKPALEAGLIEMTIPNKPNSRLQQYRITRQGQSRPVI